MTLSPFEVKGYYALPYPLSNPSPTSTSSSHITPSSSSSSSPSPLCCTFIYIKPHTGKNYIKSCIVEGINVEEQVNDIRTDTDIGIGIRGKKKNILL